MASEEQSSKKQKMEMAEETAPATATARLNSPFYHLGESWLLTKILPSLEPTGLANLSAAHPLFAAHAETHAEQRLKGRVKTKSPTNSWVFQLHSRDTFIRTFTSAALSDKDKQGIRQKCTEAGLDSLTYNDAFFKHFVPLVQKSCTAYDSARNKERPAESREGGSPYFPRDWKWPVFNDDSCKELPDYEYSEWDKDAVEIKKEYEDEDDLCMSFLAQINCADLWKACGRETPYPKVGMMYFFRGSLQDHPCVRVLYWPHDVATHGEQLHLARAPAQLENELEETRRMWAPSHISFKPTFRYLTNDGGLADAAFFSGHGSIVAGPFAKMMPMLWSSYGPASQWDDCQVLSVGITMDGLLRRDFSATRDDQADWIGMWPDDSEFGFHT